MKNTFDIVIEWVLTHEGGYSNDPDDPGNWTGGRKGKGELKGTNYGISSKAYPNLDIKGLSRDHAKAIYKRDYWDRIQGDDLPAGPDYATFDAAINSGVPQASKWLQRAVGASPDGMIGNQTLSRIHEKAVENEEQLIVDITEQRLKFMKGLSTWKKYGKGWSKRVGEVRTNAIKLARSDETYTIPSVGGGINKKARPDDIKAISTARGKIAAAIGSTTFATTAADAAQKIAPYVEYLDVLKYVFAGLMIISVGVGLYLAACGIKNGTET